MCVVSSETPARLRCPELRAGRHSAGAGRGQRPEAPDALAAVHRARCSLAAHLHRDHQQRHAALRQRLGEEARCAAVRHAQATLASRLAAYVRIGCRGNSEDVRGAVRGLIRNRRSASRTSPGLVIGPIINADRPASLTVMGKCKLLLGFSAPSCRKTLTKHFSA